MYTEWFLKTIDKKRWHKREFMIWKRKVRTYGWLSKKVNFWKQYLKKNCINAGEIVSLEGDYSPSIIAFFLALIWNKNIIVPIISGLPESELRERCRIAEVKNKFIFKDGKLRDVKKIRDKKKVENKLLKKFIKKGFSGLILFSSGSTGKPKAILHNLNTLTEKFCEVKRSFRSLIFLLFDHIGGINTLFSIISSGGTLVVSPSRKPENILSWIEKYNVELLPTSPTFLNLVLISESYKNHDCSSLELITYGTEPMPQSLLKRLKEIFPEVKFKQTYGVSEIGILSTKSESSESLWMKFGGKGFKTKIVKGILMIKSKSSMAGYLNAPNPFTEDGWFFTGDEVEVKGDYYRIIGRDTDIINVGGEKVFPSEVESVLLEIDNIEDAIVYGTKNPLIGEMVVMEVNLKKEETLIDLKKKIYKYCQDKLEKYKIPAKILIKNENLYSKRFKKIRDK